MRRIESGQQTTADQRGEPVQDPNIREVPEEIPMQQLRQEILRSAAPRPPH